MHSDSLDPERYLSYVLATSPQAACSPERSCRLHLSCPETAGVRARGSREEAGGSWRKQVSVSHAPDPRCTAAPAPGVRHPRAAGGWVRKSCWQVTASGTLYEGLQPDSRGDTYPHHPSCTPRMPADQVAWRQGAGTPIGVSRKEPTGLQAPPQGQFALGSSEKRSPSPALGLSTLRAGHRSLVPDFPRPPLVSARTPNPTEVMDSH